MAKFFVLTTGASFAVEENEYKSVQADFESDVPDPMIQFEAESLSFPGVRLEVRVQHAAVIGFAQEIDA